MYGVERAEGGGGDEGTKVTAMKNEKWETA